MEFSQNEAFILIEDTDADGTYDGTLDGPFVWSAGKLAAVKDWAERNGFDLKESFAYSDSVYDTPLLAAVGNPFVVNPDPRMALMAAARRWPTLDLSGAAGMVKEVSSMARIPVVNMEIQRLALSFTHPLFFPYAKFDISGLEHIPQSGPAIVVANHRSYFDPLAVAVTIPARGGVFGVGLDVRRTDLDDWWPPVAGSMMMGPDRYLNINNGRRDRTGLWAEWAGPVAPDWSVVAGVRLEQVETDAGDVQRKLDQVAVNSLREGLKPLELGRLLVGLRKDHKLSDNEIAAHLDKQGIPALTKGQMAELMRLVDLPEWAQEMVDAGKLDPKAAPAINAAALSMTGRRTCSSGACCEQAG